MSENTMKTIRDVRLEGDKAILTETKVPHRVIFKIKYGYGATEYVLTESLDEVAKAMYCKAEKIGLTIGGKFLSGQEIKTIEPDIHSYTGWNRAYEPQDPDDFRQIERDVPKMLYELLEGVGRQVSILLKTGDQKSIEGLTPKLLLGDKAHTS